MAEKETLMEIDDLFLSEVFLQLRLAEMTDLHIRLQIPYRLSIGSRYMRFVNRIY